MIFRAGLGLMAFGGLTTLGAWALWPPPATPDDDVTPIAIDDVDAGVDAATVAQTAADAGVDAGSTIVAVRTRDAGARRSTDVAVASRTPRIVVLDPRPPNVTIQIDDGPVRVFGPGFTQTELIPGRHRFVVEPPENTPYATLRRTITIPPGDGPHRQQLELPIADAALQVHSNVPGTVEILNARGSTGEVIMVDMSRPEINARLRVTAPGHQPHEESIQLVAGAPPRTVHMTLRPIDGTQAQAP